MGVQREVAVPTHGARGGLCSIAEAAMQGRDEQKPPPISVPGKGDDEKGEVKVPIFLLNPDGSMVEGIPPGYKDATPPRSPRRDTFWDPALVEEFEYIYSRHEKLFLSLLLIELVVEVTFNLMYAYYAEYSIHEVALVYHMFGQHTLKILFWVMFALENVYCLTYYVLGFSAIYTNKAKVYRYFATVALAGVLGQVLLAYMNKFNLLVFFLRLMAYIYAKFLRRLLQNLQLMPQPEGAQYAGP